MRHNIIQQLYNNVAARVHPLITGFNPVRSEHPHHLFRRVKYGLFFWCMCVCVGGV